MTQVIKYPQTTTYYRSETDRYGTYTETTWNAIDKIKANDNVDAYTSTIASVSGTVSKPGKVKGYNYGFNIPLNSKINYIRVYWEDVITNPNGGTTGVPSIPGSYVWLEYMNGGNNTSSKLNSTTVATTRTQHYVEFTSTEYPNLKPVYVNSSNATVVISPRRNTNYNTGIMRMDYMYVLVDYTPPTYSLTSQKPTQAPVNEEFTYTLTLTNTNNVHQGYAIPVTISLPDGVTCTGYTTNNGTYSTSTGKWNATLSNGTATITLTLKSTTAGTKLINCSVDNFNTTINDTIEIINPEATIDITLTGNDTTPIGQPYTLTININGAAYDTNNRIVTIKHPFTNTTQITGSTGITDSTTETIPDVGGQITFKPAGTGDYTLTATVTTTPTSGTELTFIAEDSDLTVSKTKTITLYFDGQLYALGQKFKTKSESIYNYIATGSNATVIAKGQYSKTLSKIKGKYDIIKGYIGCIKLEQGHRLNDASNTTTNTLLKEGYKNKVNVGKKGDFNEEIPLSIVLPRKDAITLQGLIELDEPVPINTTVNSNITDLLNHKGYAEIHKATFKYLNPDKYLCDIELYYLTRNLNPELKINLLNKVNNYTIKPVYPIQRIGTSDQIHTYFTVDTNGTYTADTNTIELPATKQAKLTTPALDTPYTLIHNYTFNTIAPDKHTRTISIKDEEDTTYLKYILQSDGTNFYGTILSYDEDNCIETFEDTITLPVNNNTYNTTTQIEIQDNTVNILETGASGIELAQNHIPLPEHKHYHIEINIENTSYTQPLTTTHTFEVTEHKYTNTIQGKYDKIIASPFPLKNKVIQYTREAEDGLIYYYKDDGTPNLYYTEPYNFYKGGVNITTHDGVSLLSNRYKSDPICLTNGLTKLEISKQYNYIKIYRYDPSLNNAQDWYEICRLTPDMIENVEIDQITQDKATIKVNTTLFTLWRGKPFISIKHPNMDLRFYEPFEKVLHDNGQGELVTENTSNLTELQFNNLFYLQLYNNLEPYGLQVIKPDYTSIYPDRIPKSNETILIPYRTVQGQPQDTPENQAFEWLNHYEQKLEIHRL